MDARIETLLQFLEENKAKDIALFDAQGEKCEEDFIVLANFSTPAENKAFAEKLMEVAGIEEYPEGYNRGEWIVISLDGVLIHTFLPQKREKYNLDKLYQALKVNLKPSKKSKR